MEKIHLYPNVVVKRQSFKGSQKLTTPNQSLSLKEILRRFVRRESLPALKQGMYEERFGDLEKLSKADIVIQMEKADEIKNQIKDFNKRQKDREEKEAEAKKKASEPPKPPADPVKPAQPNPAEGGKPA